MLVGLCILSNSWNNSCLPPHKGVVGSDGYRNFIKGGQYFNYKKILTKKMLKNQLWYTKWKYMYLYNKNKKNKSNENYTKSLQKYYLRFHLYDIILFYVYA